MLDSFQPLVGRQKELYQIEACLRANKNVLLEGPVGVGKTHLALSLVKKLGRPFFRVDGDSRYTEQKLTGWFDPPMVLKKGYQAEAFLPGPLVLAMKSGGVLFINELNRLSEGVQNVLLPAIDEKTLHLPQLESITARDGFLVIATQNPKEFVATSHLSEALLDRFELVVLDYQSEVEEIEILKNHFKESSEFVPLAVKLIRLTRDDQRIRRGASIRAAISLVEIAMNLVKSGSSPEEAFVSSAILALATRIELERDSVYENSAPFQPEEVIKELALSVFRQAPIKTLKKKSL